MFELNIDHSVTIYYEHVSLLSHTCRSTGDDDVAIKILYCGMCHSDLHSIKNEWHNATYPMVPGCVVTNNSMHICLYICTSISYYCHSEH